MSRVLIWLHITQPRYTRCMGFFSELGKAFMGKPLGPSGQNQTDRQTPANTSQVSNGILDEQGRKILPDIDFKNLRSHLDGDKLLVKAWVVNNSRDQVIRIDTTHLLKQKRQHNQQINPGDSRELKLYDGPAPRNENEHSAQVAYQLVKNGDLFIENFRIDYGLEDDGVRVVEELIDDGPVRDV